MSGIFQKSSFMLHQTNDCLKHLKANTLNIAGKVQARERSIIALGMFSWHSLGPLIIEEETMIQHKYASILADHICSCILPHVDGI